MRGGGHCQGLPRQPAREEGWACRPGWAARGGRRQRGQGQAETCRNRQRESRDSERQRHRQEEGDAEGRRRQVLVRVWETPETDNWQGGTDSQTGWLPGRERVCPGAGGSHRGMTEMDGPMAGGDKPEAGGNIEADNKENWEQRGRRGTQMGRQGKAAAV